MFFQCVKHEGYRGKKGQKRKVNGMLEYEPEEQMPQDARCFDCFGSWDCDGDILTAHRMRPVDQPGQISFFSVLDRCVQYVLSARYRSQVGRPHCRLKYPTLKKQVW